MKNTFKLIIVVSIIAVLSVSCSTKIDVNDLTGFWQGESGRGFQFTDKGTYFFYFIENDTWKCSGDSENNFSVKGNEIWCEWTEDGEIKALCYFVDSFTKHKMKLRSDPGDISDGKYIKVSEPNHVDVEERKLALASSILAQIDSLYLLYQKNLGQSFDFSKLELTEKEKLVKPEYLLNLSASNDFVTRSQKINALAIYSVECGVRKIYDMPQEGTKAVIAKLAVEVNHPIDMDFLTSDTTTTSEKIKREYEICKERGDLAYFWQFQFAVMSEMSYLVSQNPELFYSKITDEQWQAFSSRFITSINVIESLAKYDEDMSELLEFRNKYYPYVSTAEMNKINQDKEISKQFHITNKDKYIARRNALLQ